MEDKGKVTLLEKTYVSLLAGFLSSFIGTPSEISIVRFQSDGTLPPEQRRDYRNIFHALKTIVKEEGFFSLWKGQAPAITRVMSLNLGQLAVFDECK